MTVKTAVSFTERHHKYAKKKMEEGVYASVSSLVAQSIERMMQEEEERDAALAAMAETIRARLQTPRSNWVEVDNDTLFYQARQRLKSKE
jgi:antitoxin ParD1/3/4